MKNEDLIKKWLKGALTDEEQKQFDALDDALLNTYIIDAASEYKASQFLEYSNFETFKSKYQEAKRTSKQNNWFNLLLRIASVIVIALGVYFTFFSSNTTLVETLAGEKIVVELPDRSTVELNAASEIEYSVNDWQKNRKVRLYGEAFFTVAKGKTFSVVTKDGVVAVIGTKFNVKQRDDYFEVKCFEGIVKVTSNAIVKEIRSGTIFKVLNGKFTEESTLISKPTWLDNMSTFDAIPVKEVLAEFERQYQIEVVTKNIYGNRLFTGAFIHHNLKDALTAITQPMNMTYELSSSNLVIVHGKKN